MKAAKKTLTGSMLVLGIVLIVAMTQDGQQHGQISGYLAGLLSR